MRKLLAIMFLIVFSFQVLPVRTIGKLLAKGQTEEEVKHGCDDDSSDGMAKYNDLIGHSANVFSLYQYVERKPVFVIHGADDLPSSHITEIPSPPPNC